MGSSSAHAARIVLVTVMGLAGGVGSAPADSLERGTGPSRDPLSIGRAAPAAGIWTKLSFRGKNWLARFSADVEMEVPAALGPSPDADENVWVASLETDLDSFLLDDRSTRFRAYFDPITGAVARLTQHSLGSRPDYKRYFFEKTGVRRIRTTPAEGQPVDAPERWPDRPARHHAYDAERLGCRLVSSPAVLAWWLTWGPGARSPAFPDVGACHFQGKTLYRIEIERGKTRATQVDYRLLRAGQATRRQGSVPVQHYGIVSRPIAGKMDEKTVIAEMEIDIEMRLPWRFVMSQGPFQIDASLESAVLGSALRPGDSGDSGEEVGSRARDGAGDSGARTREPTAGRDGSQPQTLGR